MTPRAREEIMALFAAWIAAEASKIYERSGDMDTDFVLLHEDASRRAEVLDQVGVTIDVTALFRNLGYDHHLTGEPA
jgi:hypothetical protein